MDKYIGRLLDNRYEILEVIGTGGMAVVYKARCHRLNRLVAIKILKDDYLEDEDFRRRFHAESQAVAMLSHPNIVSVYDVSTSNEADYIVMELIEGITLKQYMQTKGVLNWKETLHFAMQIAKALDHAHSRGIVHRDIKPHNVMVLKNGSVKVADFGIARMMSKGNTLTKEALGSVHYISPEQAKGGRVDNRSDIYSLGVVMYEMMSGRPPYDGDSPVSVAIQHINGGAPMPSTLNPNIPGGLEQIIMKAMAHEIDDRYTSAAQMLSDMDEFRKDPTMLFDYNTPPLDDVTKLNKPPLVLQGTPTTAARVAESAEGQKRRTSQSGAAHNPNGGNHTQTKRKKEAAKNSSTATVAIIACSVVAVVAIVIFLVLFLGGGTGKTDLVEVPYLIGQEFGELPDYEHFDIIADKVYDEVVAEGQIFQQEPKAGDKVAKGTKITVTVSMGPTPKIVTMDDLTGLTQERAERILNNLDLNLTFRVEEEYSDEVEAGIVLRTDPEKDVELTAGQEITLYVSLGQEIKTGVMPNVLGYDESMASIILDNQNLSLKIITEEVFDSIVFEGKVVRTDPEKGEELKTGQTVKLYLSKGAETATVPNVVGMSIDKAVNTLISCGFKTPQIEYVYSDKDRDTVVNQSETKNTEIEVTTVIILEVSQGPEETEPPASTEAKVTKDVVIDLQGSAAEGACQVTVMRDGVIVYSGIVAQGAESITLKNQTGLGIVYYEVIISESDGWIERVVF